MNKHSSGSHASSLHNHSLQYQGDESRREKTEFQVNHSLQTTDKLACRDLTTYGNLHFHYSQQHTHDQFIDGAKVFNVTSLLRDYKKGACL